MAYLPPVDLVSDPLVAEWAVEALRDSLLARDPARVAELARLLAGAPLARIVDGGKEFGGARRGLVGLAEAALASPSQPRAALGPLAPALAAAWGKLPAEIAEAVGFVVAPLAPDALRGPVAAAIEALAVRDDGPRRGAVTAAILSLGPAAGALAAAFEERLGAGDTQRFRPFGAVARELAALAAARRERSVVATAAIMTAPPASVVRDPFEDLEYLASVLVEGLSPEMPFFGLFARAATGFDDQRVADYAEAFEDDAPLRELDRAARTEGAAAFVAARALLPADAGRTPLGWFASRLAATLSPTVHPDARGPLATLFLAAAAEHFLLPTPALARLHPRRLVRLASGALEALPWGKAVYEALATHPADEVRTALETALRRDGAIRAPHVLHLAARLAPADVGSRLVALLHDAEALDDPRYENELVAALVACGPRLEAELLAALATVGEPAALDIGRVLTQVGGEASRAYLVAEHAVQTGSAAGAEVWSELACALPDPRLVPLAAETYGRWPESADRACALLGVLFGERGPTVAAARAGYLARKGRQLDESEVALASEDWAGGAAAAMLHELAGDAGKAPQPVRRAAAKVGRNDPCPCGSGKKYKKCCLST